MTENVDSLVMNEAPAFEARLGVIHDRAIAMVDAIIFLIPWWNLVVRQEMLIALALHLSLCWG